MVSLKCPAAYLVAFSLASSYIVTCHKSTRVEGQLAKNLQVRSGATDPSCTRHAYPGYTQVWDLSTGEVVLALAQKAVSRDAWPMLQWLHDDSTVMHMVTNTIHVYTRADGFTGQPT